MEHLRSAAAIVRRIAAFLRPMAIPLHSAYTSFFLVLSLFPGLLLLLGVLRYTSLGVDELMAILEVWIPESLLPTARSLVDASYRHSSGMVVSISVVAALYSASRGMFGVRNGLHAVFDIVPQRNYWRKRGISMLYTAVFLLVLVVTLMFHVFSTALLDFLQMTAAPSLLLILRMFNFRFLFLLGLLTALFASMYAWLPAQRSPFRRCLPGATAAAVGWLMFTKLFSVYVKHFSRYTNIYGSVYALALGMLWLYFCICIFFYGGALNVYLHQHRQHSEGGHPI